MLRKAICRGRHGLALTIAVTSPVLNQLCDRRIITDEQRNEIEAINPREQYNRANRLLDFLVQRTEEKHFDIVCDVFKKEIQNGVVTMLEKNLAQESAESDSGYASFEAQQPIGTSSYTRQTHAHQQADSAMSTEACFTNQLDQAQEIVEENLSPELFERLENLIEPDDLLPEYLYSNECMVIDQREFERIKQEDKFTERIVVLLKVLRKKLESPWSCSRVHDALKACRQLHVSNYITYNEIHCIECGDNWPLADHQRRLLQHPLLIKGLDLSGFLDKMVTLECISDHQRKNVTSLMTSSSVDECVSRFLRMLQRRSLADYKKFFTNVVAEPTLPMDIKGLFLTTLAIALVHSKVVSQTDENVTRLENAAVKKLLSDLLKDQNWMNQLTAVRRLPRLLYPSHGKSVNWYFNCTSVDEVERLKEAYDSGELSTCLEEIFNRACGCLDGCYRLEISWSIDEYRSCLEYLNSSFVDWMASVVGCLPHDQQSALPQSTVLFEKGRNLHVQRREMGQHSEVLQATSTESCWNNENVTVKTDQLSEAKQTIPDQMKGTHLPDLVADQYSRLLDEINKLPREQQKHILWSALDMTRKSRNHFLLLQTVEYRFGLLDELLNAGVLHQKQVEVIKRKSTHNGAVRHLLRIVNKQSRDKQELFLSALDSTGQPHVSNFIRNDGERPSTETENWPLVADITCAPIRQKFIRLKKMIDTSNGLLDELVSLKCINVEQREYINRSNVDADRNERLLWAITRRSVGDFKTVIDCLTKTNQHGVISLLADVEAHTSSRNQPLCEQQMSILTENYAALIVLMNLEDSSLLDLLLSADVITQQQKELIALATTPSESNRLLLDIVREGSQSDFDSFVQCVSDTGQQNILDLLLSIGVADENPKIEEKPQQSAIQFVKDERLLGVIESQFGLLDEICSRKILNRGQIKIIERKASHNEAVHHLLDEVDKLSREQQELFLSALDKTHQSHVTNFIRNKGQRPTTDTDNWPLRVTSMFISLRQNWRHLIELIDSRNGLLEELLSVQCISFAHLQYIKNASANTGRNERLLEIVSKRSIQDFRMFIDCLMKTKQSHVVHLLEPDRTFDSRPISEQQIFKLMSNYEVLVELIDPRHSGLIIELRIRDVLTVRQAEFIDSASTLIESNRRLLDIVKRGSESDYFKFISCLEKTGQQHVADILLSSTGGLLEMRTTLSGEKEEEIVRHFTKYLSQTTAEHRKAMMDQLLELLSDADTKLIAVQAHH